MSDAFVIFWAALVFTSVAWYAFLVFYVGIKAGREIRELTKNLEADRVSGDSSPGGRPRPNSLH